MTRKTKTALITVCLLLTVTVVYALAAAGGASDPLASLSYLTGTFTDAVDQRVEEKLDASDQALLNGDAAPSDGGAATWMETRLKAGDALTGSTGTGVLLLAGGMQVTFNSGAVVDVTTGTTVTSGSALTASHRYLVAEETTAVFTVTSKTAVVDYQGPYAFSYSTNTDYNAIAAALKTMHLFQGSFTGSSASWARRMMRWPTPAPLPSRTSPPGPRARNTWATHTARATPTDTPPPPSGPARR